MLRCRPIGVLQATQSRKGKKERNDRFFFIPEEAHFEADLKDVRKLSRIPSGAAALF